MIKSGDKCIVNSFGDLSMCYEHKPFINQPCTVVKVTKSGLIQVSLDTNPKVCTSVPKRNIDLQEIVSHES